MEDFRGTEMTEEQLYQFGVGVLVTTGRASTAFLQRRLLVGYNAAARVMERAEYDGVVTRANHVGKRDVLLRCSGALGGATGGATPAAPTHPTAAE